MSKKLSATQVKQLETQRVNLLKQLDSLNKIEKPTETQLEELERVEAEIASIDEALASDIEPEYEGPMVVDMSDEAKGYKVPTGEENHVHIRMFVGNRFDALTGKEIATYTIQKFSINDFKNFEKQASRLGYRYGFMHKPTGFKSIFSKK